MKPYSMGSRLAHGHESCDAQQNPPDPLFKRGEKEDFRTRTRDFLDRS